MIRHLLLLAVAVATVTAKLEVGTCPEASNKQDFEIPPYLGRWFEMMKFQDIFELGMSCITADYAAITDTAISIINTGNLLGEVVVVEGNGTATGEPGQLEVFFSDASAGLYNVIYTDYENVTCLYTCEQYGELMEEYAWIHSRTMVLDEDILSYVLSIYEGFGIDISKFLTNEQGGDCIYNPEPPQGTWRHGSKQ